MIDLWDADAIRARRPFLVAHRGGVIGSEFPENSLPAIRLAGKHGYAMVEVDVMETADAEPVLLHDGLAINCGVKKRIHDLTSDEVTAIRYRASDQHVITLAQAVEACAALDMGLMLDKLRSDSDTDPEMSDQCMARIVALIKDAGLARSTVAIVDTDRLRSHLGEVALFPVRKEDYDRIKAGDTVSLQGQFWFGWADELPNDAVKRLLENGILSIVSINTFHYPKHAPYSLARMDIARLLAAGVDGFQIDDVYEDCFAAKPKASGGR